LPHFRRITLALTAAVIAFSPLARAQGRIDCGALRSQILARTVRYCVLLPPSYESDRDKKYPVLYFLHGLGENEQVLVRSGGWGLIEELRQKHQIGEFLIAVPEGRGSFFINSAAGRDRYSDFFLSEFIPYVESHFRSLRDRTSRGVTGLSMGGYGALRFAFARPELFRSVSAQSPALLTETPEQLDEDLRDAGRLTNLLGSVFGNPIEVPHWRANSPFDLARKNRSQIQGQAIYFNCGGQDEYGFAEGATKLDRQLTSEGIKHEFHLYPGGHDAEYFLSHLAETMEFHSRAFAASQKSGKLRGRTVSN
jgi:S-formylglutathione hydrolase FrmB